MNIVKFFVAIGILAYAVAVLGMYVLQRKLQYVAENKGLTPESVGVVDATVETLITPDGEKIVVWYAPAAKDKPTILYFHGNAGEIGDRPLRFNYYHSRGFGVAYVSYRGYGGSTGQPTEQGLITDANTAYDWLIAKGIAPHEIALLGESLGSGIAIQIAAKKQVGAVALNAPYTSTADVAARIYWWLPVRALMKDQYKSINFVSQVKAPLLVVHGDLDILIPLEFGKKLFAAANEPKEMEIIRGFGHEAMFEEVAWAREVEFFARVMNRE